MSAARATNPRQRRRPVAGGDAGEQWGGWNGSLRGRILARATARFGRDLSTYRRQCLMMIVAEVMDGDNNSRCKGRALLGGQHTRDDERIHYLDPVLLGPGSRCGCLG